MKYLGPELSKFSEQIHYAVKNYQSHGKKISDFRNIVISGLGGSGISGKIIKNYYADKISIPVEVVSDYKLPKFVNEDTLVILCSYSGNTEETLSTYADAKEKGAYRIVLSVGGKLKEMAAADGVSVYHAEAGYQPRVAFGYPVTYLFLVFSELLGLTIDAELQGIIKRVNNVDDYTTRSLKVREFFKDQIKNKYVIIASPDMEGIAIRLAQQIQENAKLEAFVTIIPEANHNVIETYYEKWNSNYIMLNSGLNKRVNLRFHFIKELIEGYEGKVYDLPTKEMTMENLFDTVFLLDWVSIQIADEISAVSNQIKNIISLKDFLNNQ